jgi:hypothetical protein
MGWTSRAWILGDHDAKVVSGGLFRPFALVHGRAVATWSIDEGRVALKPFVQIGAGDEAALQQDADDVLRFLAPATHD